MPLFAPKKPKNYADIVFPLKRIESDLSTYIGDKNNEITQLNEEKNQIDRDIEAAGLEVKKSEHTVVKISELLALDLDMDGKADVEDTTPPEVVEEEASDTEPGAEDSE